MKIYLVRASLFLCLSWGLILSGCCPNCEGQFLGEFAIQEDTEAWFAFVNTQPVLFRSSGGGQRSFVYELPVRAMVDVQENCVETRCQLCCDEFRAETLTYQMSNGVGGLNFVMQIEKDFSQAGSTDDRPDVLLFSLNGGLRCSAGNLPDNAILTNITLNGQTFNGVIACENNPQNASNSQDNIYAYYFQPQRGIVGFIQADGTEWALSI